MRGVHDQDFLFTYGVSARPYESCKKILGLAPPRCAFETGTTDAPSKLVQLWYKSFPPGRFLPGGNEQANYDD